MAEENKLSKLINRDREPKDVGAGYRCDCGVDDIDNCMGGMDCHAEEIPRGPTRQKRRAPPPNPIPQQSEITHELSTVTRVALSERQVQAIIKNHLTSVFGKDFTPAKAAYINGAYSVVLEEHDEDEI